MRAVVCSQWGGPETLAIEDIASPEPGPGEVKIRVHAAGVNFPDVLIIQKKYQLQPPLPFSPGAEIAGEVISVGEGVNHLKAGDRVVSLCGIGGFAEEAIAPAAATMPMPPGVPYERAAVFSLAYGTSWHAVRDRAALQAGETMLVLGAAGGVGLAAVEIGKALGARVVACASTDEKLDICKQHGADALINYASGDIREAIKRECGKNGPDVIYDPVGGKFAEPCFRSIAWRGRYLVVGFADGEIPALPLNLALLKGASLVGVFWGEFAKREPANNQKGMAEMFGWIREGTLKPLISRTYRLDEAPHALMDIAARKVVGKVVVVP
ncbi:MAG: NADPH:quinone oxidoreductase family protein [Betaproteobacteria bacterium]|nr:NADPH:quinone oxidoreductase family protein [Betaproteobacteria bacterium]